MLKISPAGIVFDKAQVMFLRGGLGSGGLLPIAISLYIFISVTTISAQSVYSLDFTPPELGSYQVTAGNPTIQPTAGGFTDALVFSAVTGGEQIRLPVMATSLSSILEFDVLTHNIVNSEYSFVVYFDTATSRSISLHGGLNGIYFYQGSPLLSQSFGALANDFAYHFEVGLDPSNAAMSLAINGSFLFSGSCDAGALQAIRFGIAPWIGGATTPPNTYVALDNVSFYGVPEPSSLGIVILALLLLAFTRNACKTHY